MCPQVECSDRDLHSGVYGGSVHEAMTDLIMLMGEREWAPAAIWGSSLPPSLVAPSDRPTWFMSASLSLPTPVPWSSDPASGR